MSDASGREAIEVHRCPAPAGPEGSGGAAARVEPLAASGLGRLVELVPSPDGSKLALTNHQYQLLLVDVANGQARVLDESAFGRPAGPTWSPDGRWLVYSFPASASTSQIKLADVDGGGTSAVTEPEFRDSCPSFDPTGKYLYFLSLRTFDPVHDSMFLDLGFPCGARPYLVTLQADRPSPFLVPPEPEEASEEEHGAAHPPKAAPPPGDAQRAEGAQREKGPSLSPPQCESTSRASVGESWRCRSRRHATRRSSP